MLEPCFAALTLKLRSLILLVAKLKTNIGILACHLYLRSLSECYGQQGQKGKLLHVALNVSLIYIWLNNRFWFITVKQIPPLCFFVSHFCPCSYQLAVATAWQLSSVTTLWNGGMSSGRIKDGKFASNKWGASAHSSWFLLLEAVKMFCALFILRLCVRPSMRYSAGTSTNLLFLLNRPSLYRELSERVFFNRSTYFQRLSPDWFAV